jgi:hypothetical protein
MIARSFKSVAWVAAIGVAALVCYMFSLRVAEERAGLTELEAQIRRTQQSIQTLRTELGTRGRVHQLQHWASTDFGFTSPKAGQFLDSEVTLATLDMQAQVPALEAPVQMAQAQPAPAELPNPIQAAAPAPAPAPAPARPAVRQASAQPEERERPLLRQAAVVRAGAPAATTRPAARPAAASAGAAARPAAAPVHAGARPAAAPVRAAARTAAAPNRPTARSAPVKPVARGTALVAERTLTELGTRSRAERRAN